MTTFKDWLGTFWKIMVSPRAGTFLAEAQKADGKFVSAVGWLAVCAAYVYFLTSISIGPTPLGVLVAVVILLPVAVVLFTSAMYHSYRRLTHGKQDVYDKMLYLTVAILLPLQLIFIHVTLLLPVSSSLILGYVLLLYQTALVVMALKTIANIEYWQALACVFVAVLAAIVVSGVVFLLLYSTLAAPGVSA